MEEDREKKTDHIFANVFYKGIKEDYNLNNSLYNAIKLKLLLKIEEAMLKNDCHSKIIKNMKSLLPAIIQGEKLLLGHTESDNENALSSSSKETSVDVDNASQEDEDFVAKLKKTGKKKTDDSKTKYFLYLSEYKKDKDMLERVQALQLRGKSFRVSNDGSCPKCRYRSNVFVILDLLFLDNDMPEMLQYLIAQGKACLWSSKDDLNCKDPPTFLCGGRCPSDVTKSGFNINWETTDLEKIFLFPESNYVEKEVKKPEVEPIVKDLGKSFKNEVKETGEKKLSDVEITYEVFGARADDVVGEIGRSNQADKDDDERAHVLEETVDRESVSWVVLDEEIDDRDNLLDNEDDIIRTMLAIEEAKEKQRTMTEKNDEQTEAAELSVDNNKVEDEMKADDNYPESNHTAKETFLDKLKDNAMNERLVSTTVVTTASKTSDDTVVHVSKDATHYQETTNIKNTNKKKVTSADFPISNDGSCPYCHSNNVIYIIIDDGLSKEELPQLLRRLKSEGHAKLMPKGGYDLPSFQCNGCTYGFNLDWSKTTLEKIFPTSAKTTTAKSSVASTYTDPYSAYYYQQTANPYAPGGVGGWGYNPLVVAGYGIAPMYPSAGLLPHPYNQYAAMVDPRYQYGRQFMTPQQNYATYSANSYNRTQQITCAPPVENPASSYSQTSAIIDTVEGNSSLQDIPLKAENNSSTNSLTRESVGVVCDEKVENVNSDIVENKLPIAPVNDPNYTALINNAPGGAEMLTSEGVPSSKSENTPIQTDLSEKPVSPENIDLIDDVSLQNKEKSFEAVESDPLTSEILVHDDSKTMKEENTAAVDTSKNDIELNGDHDNSSNSNLKYENNIVNTEVKNKLLNEKVDISAPQVSIYSSSPGEQNKKEYVSDATPSTSSIIKHGSINLLLQEPVAMQVSAESPVQEISRKRKSSRTVIDSPSHKKKTTDGNIDLVNKELTLNLQSENIADGIASLDEVSDFIMDETTLKENKQMWSIDSVVDNDSPFTDLLVNIVSDLVAPSEQTAASENTTATEIMTTDAATNSGNELLEHSETLENSTDETSVAVTSTKRSTKGRPKGTAKRGRGRGRGRKKK